MKCLHFTIIRNYPDDDDDEIITMGGGGAERPNVMSLCSKWYITNKIKIVMIVFGYFTLKYQLS
jgi:hypothetical protein